MEQIDLLKKYGLFDAKVPRYTSYPPANHFQKDIGSQNQEEWLQTLPVNDDISIYVHIPFCRRICWFCACRTQGTKTLRPIENYIKILKKEILAVSAKMPQSIKMAKLHLGGGTPTLLSSETMKSLLETIFENFDQTETFEFSVEIDPTEAQAEVLNTLIDFGLNRASIGVQDFNPKVQNAIGRKQSFKQTKEVINYLREKKVPSLNIDLLYGLPHQTLESYKKTLEKVLLLEPDRLAIYGYAHVPWMSKRQALIIDTDLPNNELRYYLSKHTYEMLTSNGYDAIGIDHFALPLDSLAIAQKKGVIKRNFQGYTDDNSKTLIGFGASAISKFKNGYSQNAPVTSDYLKLINAGHYAGQKGYVLSPLDHLTSHLIQELMCNFEINTVSLWDNYDNNEKIISQIFDKLLMAYPDIIYLDNNSLKIKETAQPLVRIIAKSIDAFTNERCSYSSAI
tara:strand:- start:14 stop:1369 length:1356 start_codon:yes stop_codon:yes gene_type:complete